eukprot:g5208.t1
MAPVTAEEASANAARLKALSVLKKLNIPTSSAASGNNSLGSSTSTSRATGEDGRRAGSEANKMFSKIISINEYPQNVRRRVMAKEEVFRISEISGGAAITNKGVHVPEGKKPREGEVPLHLLVESDSEIKLGAAVKEIMRLLEEETAKAGGGGALATHGDIASRYGSDYAVL